MKNEIVIADTSCLITLHRIGQLDLIRAIFDKISITEEVNEEFGQPLPDWVSVVKVMDLAQKRLLMASVDRGEASSIAYCLEQKVETLLIIDERKGRKLALELGLKIIGTLGLVIKAKENGLVISAKALIERLEAEDFRISATLKADILKQLGES